MSTKVSQAFTALVLALSPAVLAACSNAGTAPSASKPPALVSPRSSTSTTLSPSTTTTTATTTTATTTLPPTTSTVTVPSNSLLPSGLGGRDWNLIPTHDNVVALTFDAGANADGVTSILDTLRQNNVVATFFLTGNFAEQFKAQSQAIASAGMRIGDHSISHPYLTQLSDAEVRYQVLGARDEIQSVTGADPWPWFRFPYGDRNDHTIALVNSLGFVPIGWTVDTLGWKGTSGQITVQTVVSRVLASLQPGEIVLMHCGSNPTDHSTLDAEALPTVIAELRARGYSFVTIDALRS
jgi:peptidoglycan/xylan/chitin deacetylase (PgdA/CDA1 family)